jgi:hypothetical protein
MCPDTERSGRLASPQWQDFESTSLPPAFDLSFAAVPTATTTEIVVFSSTLSSMFSLNGRHQIILILIPTQTGIPKQRLHDWKRNWTLNQNWRYWSDGHWRHYHIFTHAEECGISDDIPNNYINAGRLFTDATFRGIAVQAYLEKHQGDEDIRQFNCSTGLLTISRRGTNSPPVGLI